jgi:Membrane proteins related to metalloendopeptidases
VIFLKKLKLRRYLIQTLTFLCISLVCIISFIAIDYLSDKEPLDESETLYVSYEVLTDNVRAVSKENKNILIRPYSSEDVSIGKDFYDYKGDKEIQEKAIVYYQGSYIQNSGVDYISKNIFDVKSVLDGKVVSIINDDIVGTTIKIEHSNNIVSVYQSLSEVLVKENETVSQGQIIGKSGTNTYSSDLGNHLHFELCLKNKLVNPEEYYNKPLEEL